MSMISPKVTRRPDAEANRFLVLSELHPVRQWLTLPARPLGLDDRVQGTVAARSVAPCPVATHDTLELEFQTFQHRTHRLVADVRTRLYSLRAERREQPRCQQIDGLGAVSVATVSRLVQDDANFVNV